LYCSAPCSNKCTPHGERLFGETSDKKPMRLVDTQTGDDVAFLAYEPVRDA